MVATVDGKELTAADLQQELAQGLTDPSLAAAAQKQALQNLIARKIVADYAIEKGLDKTPQAAMLLNRARDNALVELVQNSIGKAVPAISNEEASEYVKAHPESFAQRKLISVDQYVIPQVSSALAKQLQPLETLDQVATLLTRNNVYYIRSAATMDTLSLPPELAVRVGSMPVGSLLMTPTQEGGALMSSITATRDAPLADPEAQRTALTILSNQRKSQQIQNALAQIVEQGQSKIKINPAYAEKKLVTPAKTSTDNQIK